MRVGKWGGEPVGGGERSNGGESGINGGEKLGGHHAKNFRKYDIFCYDCRGIFRVSRAMLKSTRVTLS